LNRLNECGRNSPAPRISDEPGQFGEVVELSDVDL